MGFLKLQFVAKYEKIRGGDPLEILKIFEEKNRKIKFLNSVTVPKNVKGEPLGIFSHPICCKISIQIKGDQVKNTKIAKGGSLVCFQGLGGRFCVFRFERGSEVLSVLNLRSSSCCC